jgi:hypothetical protein
MHRDSGPTSSYTTLSVTPAADSARTTCMTDTGAQCSNDCAPMCKACSTTGCGRAMDGAVPGLRNARSNSGTCLLLVSSGPIRDDYGGTCTAYKTEPNSTSVYR